MELAEAGHLVPLGPCERLDPEEPTEIEHYKRCRTGRTERVAHGYDRHADEYEAGNYQTDGEDEG